MIVEASCLKEGTGKELHQLHDTIVHEQLVTAMIVLKLDSDTMFKWQKHNLATSDFC
jgi:hypothetical protein